MSQTAASSKLVWTALTVLLVVVLAGAVWRFVFGQSPVQSTNDAYVNADFTLVAPKVSGFIEQVLVEDNQQVKAGEVLARIDAKDYQAEVAAADAAIATAHANVENASAALVRQQALIAQARAVVEGDVSQVEFAQHELLRYQNWRGRGPAPCRTSSKPEAACKRQRPSKPNTAQRSMRSPGSWMCCRRSIMRRWPR